MDRYGEGLRQAIIDYRSGLYVNGGSGQLSRYESRQLRGHHKSFTDAAVTWAAVASCCMAVVVVGYKLGVLIAALT